MLMSLDDVKAQAAREQDEIDAYYASLANNQGTTELPLPTRTIYEVPAARLPTLLTRVGALIKKANRYATTPITLDVLGDEVRVTRIWIEAPQMIMDGQPVGGSYVDRRIRYHFVRVVGEAPKVDGWTFVATLQHAGEAGTIIRSIPGASLPERFRTATSSWCDHCRTSRQRNDTYVLRNDAGEHKQVGSSCLADFLGGIDPKRIAALCESLASIADSFGGGEREEVVDLPNYLVYVSEAIRRHGWLSRTAARNFGGHATADVAFQQLEPTKHMVETGLAWTKLDPASGEEAATALAWVREHLDEKEQLGDYEHNLKVVLTTDAVDRRGLGIAASAISYYQRELGFLIKRQERERVEKAAAAVSTSEYVGTVGKREVFKGLLVERVFSFDGHYGVSHLHKMVDARGNVFCWSTGERLVEGLVYDLKATVKAHEAYREIKQTLITRCAVQAEYDVASDPSRQPAPPRCPRSCCPAKRPATSRSDKE
jgi:hypothetical protein